MILAFGKTGQVAIELQRIGDVTALGREDVDLLDPQACKDAIKHHSFYLSVDLWSSFYSAT